MLEILNKDNWNEYSISEMLILWKSFDIQMDWNFYSWAFTQVLSHAIFVILVNVCFWQAVKLPFGGKLLKKIIDVYILSHYKSCNATH